MLKLSSVMKLPQLLPAVVIAASVALSSCASLRDAGNHSVAIVRQSGSAAAAKLSTFSVTGLLPGPHVAVVKVREKDLKPLPTGHERAIAYASEHQRGFWFFGGPVDFKEPTLPEPGGEPDGSLLPPRIP